MSDVCLILEGTYPYITGGVSSCAHQLIEETPSIEYDLLFIGSKKELNTDYKYKIPNNVRTIQEVYLFDNDLIDSRTPRLLGLDAKQIHILKNSILFNKEGSLDQLYHEFFKEQTRTVEPSALFFSKEIWNILIELYHETFTSSTAPSFIDFFYNWRFSNLPVFKILSVNLPNANIYHSLCTGYAGLLGCLAKIDQRGSYILTEHGIYTNERKIEISQSEWIYSTKNDIVAKNKLSYFKEWWLSKFYTLGQLSYLYADRITTLYEGNKVKQIALGAEARKIDIIANGINEEKLRSNLNEELNYKKRKKFTVGLIGRVVPVKDIKTFIKSVSKVTETLQDVEFLILGPIDEDLDYYNDCVMLVQQLGLDDYISFPGKVNLKYYYPSIDLIILSSISEGQPLVLLEAFCFSIPAVTTDVGSCRELIEGSSVEDKSIGPAGHVVPFGVAGKLGEKILDLLQRDIKRKEYGENAYKRFKQFYQVKYTIRNYVEMYQSYFMDEL